MAVTSSLASVMLLVLFVAAGPAWAQQQQQQGGPQQQQQQQQPCGCSPPTAGAEVCGSDDHTYPSQCHLDCMARGLPQGHSKYSWPYFRAAKIRETVVFSGGRSIR